MHKINIIFDDSPYVRSHRKEPHGRGSWVFAGRPNGDVMKAKFSPGDMSLSEAKRWARIWVEHHNRHKGDPPSTLVLYVLP